MIVISALSLGLKRLLPLFGREVRLNHPDFYAERLDDRTWGVYRSGTDDVWASIEIQAADSALYTYAAIVVGDGSAWELTRSRAVTIEGAAQDAMDKARYQLSHKHLWQAEA